MKILLWEKRMEKRYSLSQLRDATDISRSTLNNIENEKVSPTLMQLEKIARGLEIGIVDLFESEYKYSQNDIRKK